MPGDGGQVMEGRYWISAKGQMAVALAHARSDQMNYPLERITIFEGDLDPIAWLLHGE